MKSESTTSSLCRLLTAASAGILLALGQSNASAADRTWNGGGDQSSWSDPANWGGTAPVATDSLFFGGATGLAPNNNLSANTVFSGITFNSGAGAFAISGAQVNLSGGVTNNSTALQTFNLTLNNNGANRDYVTAAGDIECYDVDNSKVIKSGAGTLTFRGNNDHNGTGAIINGGVLVLAKDSTGSVHGLGSDTTVNTNGTLRIAGTGADQIWFRVNLIMNGGVVQLQTLNLEEEIQMLRGSSPVSVVENGLAGTTNKIRVGGNRNNKAIYGGNLRDGAAGVLDFEVRLANNIQVLNGTNTYTGATIVNANDGGGTAAPSRLIVNGAHTGGGAYTISGNPAVATRSGSLGGSGVISAAQVDFNDNGMLSPGGQISADANNATFSDTTAILTISNVVNLNTGTSSLDVQLNGTTPGTGHDQVKIAGPGSFSNNAANLKLTAGYLPAAGDKFTIVQVQGTDPANNVGAFASLNGVATDLSHGAIFVDSGTGKSFQISYHAEGSTFDAGANGNDIMLQVVTPVGGANLTYRGNGTDNNWDVTTTADWWNGTSLVTFTNGDFVTFDNSGSNNSPLNLVGNLSPTTLNVNATKDYILAGGGKLTGTVVLTKTNTCTFTLVTDNDYIGTTLVQNGTLQLGTNGTTGSITATATLNASGTLAYNRSDDIVITNAAFAGPGSVVHKGSGKMTVAANVISPDYTGNTFVNGGELQLGEGTGTVGALGGKISIGSTNVLRYYHNGTGANSTVANSLSGNGTVIYDYPGIIYHTYTIPTTIGNSNFTGTNILKANVKLDVPSDGLGLAFGNGAVVDATATGCKVSIGRTLASPYNQKFLIAGPGWSGEFPTLGALHLWRSSITGPIVLMGDSAVRVSGGTIWGQISGSYNLNLQTDTNGYPNDVMTLNPTNGANSYGNTLVSGYVRAVNPGALSPNGLAVDLGGRLDVYGTTITVANLQNGLSGGGFIANSSGTTNGTLIVGTDDSSTAFDGVFGNGGSRPLDLTKVGAGTLTLSGVSTNTGTVTVTGGTLALTGSGSFNNAAKISVGSGAFYDVAAAGGTLNLNNGQTLAGNGTVNGNVVASSGSTITPGSSVGTLTVAGNVSLSGNLVMELNRSLAPNSDRLAVSAGSITGGGNLTVTNIGAALQVGDTFQLFTSGVSGITSTLPTVDVVNGLAYTWQDNIASTGAITVQSVAPIAAPTLGVAQSGNTLTFSWSGPFKLQSQTNSLSVGITTNWGNYPGGSTSPVNVTINPANPTVFFRLSLQ